MLNPIEKPMASNMPHTESQESLQKTNGFKALLMLLNLMEKNMHIQCISHTKNPMNPIKNQWI